MSNAGFVEEDYERIATDPAYGARLLADPVGLVCKLFGYTPKAGFAMEVIEQAEDTIVIVIPPRPQTGANLEQALSQVADRVLDLLFSSGAASSFRMKPRNGTSARCGWHQPRRRRDSRDGRELADDKGGRARLLG